MRIAQTVTAIGVTSRSVQDVKDKWKNMQSLTKKEYSAQKKSFGRTGGGPPAKNQQKQRKESFACLRTLCVLRVWMALKPVVNIFNF